MAAAGNGLCNFDTAMILGSQFYQAGLNFLWHSTAGGMVLWHVGMAQKDWTKNEIICISCYSTWSFSAFAAAPWSRLQMSLVYWPVLGHTSPICTGHHRAQFTQQLSKSHWKWALVVSDQRHSTPESLDQRYVLYPNDKETPSRFQIILVVQEASFWRK